MSILEKLRYGGEEVDIRIESIGSGEFTESLDGMEHCIAAAKATSGGDSITFVLRDRQIDMVKKGVRYIVKGAYLRDFDGQQIAFVRSNGTITKAD